MCKNNKYDQAKYFLDIYSDSAEMSREKSIFVYLLFIADEPDDVFFTGQNHLIVQVGAGIKRGA